MYRPAQAERAAPMTGFLGPPSLNALPWLGLSVLSYFQIFVVSTSVTFSHQGAPPIKEEFSVTHSLGFPVSILSPLNIQNKVF